MKINIMSDLHLDGSNMSFPEDDFDIVILAGDIAVDTSLLEQVICYKIKSSTTILFVPGNHEFEGKDFHKAIQYYSDLEKEYHNFKFLYNKSVKIDNFKFIGTTLWSNFEGAGINHKQAVKDWAKKGLCDIKSIYEITNGKPKQWNPDRVEEEFNKAYKYLEYELKINTNSKLKNFVITHFAPSRKSIDKRFEHDITSAYWSNNLSDSLIGFSDYWVHGHLHCSYNYAENGTQIICNPRGYSKLFDISENVSFDKNLIIDTNYTLTKKIKP